MERATGEPAGAERATGEPAGAERCRFPASSGRRATADCMTCQSCDLRHLTRRWPHLRGQGYRTPAPSRPAASPSKSAARRSRPGPVLCSCRGSGSKRSSAPHRAQLAGTQERSAPMRLLRSEAGYVVPAMRGLRSLRQAAGPCPGPAGARPGRCPGPAGARPGPVHARPVPRPEFRPGSEFSPDPVHDHGDFWCAPRSI